MLSGRIPLLKVDSLRSLLKENGVKLTHSFHISDCIPPLSIQEKEKVSGELKVLLFLVISCYCVFDGTTCNRKALAVFFMCFIKKWKVE